jgi:predicted dehydrogenase
MDRCSTCLAPMIFVPDAGTGFTILGSGFGLYGYLPALVESGVEVALPLRYRPTLEKRSELTRYLPQVTWCADTEEALARVDGVVVALRPIDQAAWIPRLAALPNLRRLILEKPVAADPKVAASLLAMLRDAGKRYRVGYTFRLLPWAHRLRKVLTEAPDSISLEWNFMAHHYRADLDNWKRFSLVGGGALRFYGIHLIALLAEFGYHDVSESTIWSASETEAEAWQATFRGAGLVSLTLKVNSRLDTPLFRIVARGEGEGRVVVDQGDPFASAAPNAFPRQDPRVDVLVRLYQSFDETDELHTKLQRNVLELWATVERNSKQSAYD